MTNKVRSFGLLMLISMVGSSQIAFTALAADIIPDKTVPAAVDTTSPADVSNVKAVGGDGMVTLSWDAATDNVGVKGYKILYGNTPVTADSGSYTLGPIDAKNVLTYDVKGLENGKTYYFVVTAYDASANESEFYSNEVSGTPKAGGTAAGLTDTVAPKVVSATANYKNSVSLKFSEAVKLPLTKPESAFSVKEDLAETNLNVTKAEIDTTDKSGKTVLLTTDTQKKGVKYVLTVGIQLQDLAGNPMVSGTSDTAVFTGSDSEKAELKPAADTTTTTATKTDVDSTAPAFTSVKALSANTVEVNFSEPVVLLSNATENFIITDAKDNTKITNISKVSVAQNGQKITLTTDTLDAKQYYLVAMKVKDAAGNAMSVENTATMFEGVAATSTDKATTDTTKTTTNGKDTVITDNTKTKPADVVYDLVAKSLTKMVINLSWKTNADKMANVANLVVYLSTDKGVTYGNGVVLKKDAKSYDFKNLKEDMVYYMKLTTKDKNGLESDGVVTFFTLPKTGPEIGFLIFGSAGLSAWLTKRKKK